MYVCGVCFLVVDVCIVDELIFQVEYEYYFGQVYVVVYCVCWCMFECYVVIVIVYGYGIGICMIGCVVEYGSGNQLVGDGG